MSLDVALIKRRWNLANSRHIARQPASCAGETEFSNSRYDIDGTSQLGLDFYESLLAVTIMPDRMSWILTRLCSRTVFLLGLACVTVWAGLLRELARCDIYCRSLGWILTSLCSRTAHFLTCFMSHVLTRTCSPWQYSHHFSTYGLDSYETLLAVDISFELSFYESLLVH